MPTSKQKTNPKIGDDAVKARTGKSWQQWFDVLDKAGARKMGHKEIAEYLSEKQNVPPWWSQMVTVTYEQQTGKRAVHEKPEGYQISVSRTIDTPLAKLYKAFADGSQRANWLGEDNLEVRKATSNKSMRVTWKDKKTSLEINFYPKSAKKSQVVVQHSKLANESAAAKMKTYWSKALDRLRDSVQ